MERTTRTNTFESTSARKNEKAKEAISINDAPEDAFQYNAQLLGLSNNEAPTQKKANPEEEVQMKASEEEELQMKKGAESSQSSMPEDVQTKMESSFGADFSSVNIHENSSSAKDMNALAYTQGNDVHFAPGQYNPTSKAGQELLGHELTHVVQQRQGRVAATTQEKGMGVNDDNALEKEADDMGRKAANGEKTNLNSHGNANEAVQKKAVQFYRNVPPSAIIVDVRSSANTILQKLEAAASYSCGTYDNVNWRSRLLPDIEGAIQNMTLRSIPFNFIETNGINTAWNGTISFEINGAKKTGRSSQENVTRNYGGNQSSQSGNSQSMGSSSGVSLGVEAEKGGGKGSAGLNLGTSSSNTSSRNHGVSGSGGGSYSTQETLDRYVADLHVYIDIEGAPDYSSWYDYVNPVKWGGSMAVDKYSGRFKVGSVYYDMPRI